MVGAGAGPPECQEHDAAARLRPTRLGGWREKVVDWDSRPRPVNGWWFVSFVVALIVGTILGAVVLFVYLDGEPEVPADTVVRPSPVGSARQDSPAHLPTTRIRSDEIDGLLAGEQQGEQEREMLFEQLLELEMRLNDVVERVEQLSVQGIEDRAAPTLPTSTDAAPVGTAENAVPMQVYMDVGLDPAQVEEIQRRQADLEMERLYLRDQAIREGWIGSDRYAERLDELESGIGQLREELGDDAFDRYLYASGRPNRVRIQSLIEGSPAEQAGLRAGDVIVSYAGRRILAYGDLTGATTAGDVGSSVRVSVRRGESVVDVFVPRGPLGVRLAAQRMAP